MLNNYRLVFQNRSFSLFFFGFTFSVLGDSMTRVALTWFVYEATHSAAALGWLAFCYTGPILIGGLVAGSLLDRFDRRVVMVADNVVRGLAMAAIPLLNAFGLLAVWHVYIVAAVYGLLMMISLAGGPSVIPSLVQREQLATANALETFSFTLGGVIGPVIAGLLIVRIGAPNVVILDALSYFIFAFSLVGLRLANEPHEAGQPQTQYRLKDAVALLLKDKILFSTTFMFLAFNIGAGGFISVWLPILADQSLNGGSELYGLLLGAWAVGEVISAFVAGSRTLPAPLGSLICYAQMLSGASLLLLLFSSNVWLVTLGLILIGVFDAPLTIWAQTLRMQVIPERLRGRTFALLRTLIQSGNPIGGAVAGALLPAIGLTAMIALSGLFVGLPGLIGYQVKDLRQGGPSHADQSTH